MKHILLFVLLLSASMTVVAQETMPATGATQAQQTMGDETYTDIHKEYTDDPDLRHHEIFVGSVQEGKRFSPDIYAVWCCINILYFCVMC